MKTLLVMLLVSICVIAYRSPDIMHAIGLAGAAQDPATLTLQQTAVAPQVTPMTMDEFAKLSKTDPKAYQKFLNSRQVQEERSEVDKLLNFFARGKFE